MGKSLRFFCAIFFVSVFFNLYATAQENIHGRELCDSFYDFLEGTEAIPSISPLVAEGANNFPYNITAAFSMPPITHAIDERNTFVLAFTIEDAYAHKNLIAELIKKISETELGFQLVLLFTYGDNDTDAIRGTQIYATQYDDIEDVAAMCISFGKENGKTQIIPGGTNDISPKWSVSYAVRALTDAGIKLDISGGNFISLYRLGIIAAEKRVSDFLNAEIPATGISYSKNELDEAITQSLVTLLRNYNPQETKEWERHYFAANMTGKVFFIGEKIIVISFMALTAAAMAILIFLTLFHEQKKSSIGAFFRILYVIVITLAVSTIALQASQSLSKLAEDILGAPIFIGIALKIVISFTAIVLLFDLSSRFLIFVTERQYWFLTAAVAVINFFVFSMIDISFSFVFAFELVIIYLARTVHKPVQLLIMFFMMALPFFPLVYQAFVFIDTNFMNEIVYATPAYNASLAAVLFPFQLQWLRVISSTYKGKEGMPRKHIIRRQLFLVLVPFFSFCVIVIIATAIINKYSNFQQTGKKTEQISYIADDVIKISVEDISFFGETTRTLRIDLGEEAFSCKVYVKGVSAIPVVYSENEYTTDTSNMAAEFIIPAWPPKNLSFRYIVGAEDVSEILITAKYLQNNSTLVRTVTKTVLPGQTFDAK